MLAIPPIQTEQAAAAAPLAVTTATDAANAAAGFTNEFLLSFITLSRSPSLIRFAHWVVHHYGNDCEAPENPRACLSVKCDLECRVSA